MVYKVFMDWRSLNNHVSFTEEILLAYFKELSKKYKSPSLWTLFSMLRSTLNINNGINIEYYVKLRTFLKSKSKGYQAKTVQTFTPDEINKFIQEAPDNVYLATKVASIMGIMGACHATELHLISINDVEDLGSALLVNVPNTKTKIGRRFTITGNFYQICKKYMDLRPANSTSNSFFLHYQKGKCITQNIGVNKLKAMGKQIARFLKLPCPELYTGHSFRKSSAGLYIDTETSASLLPEKSRKKYETVYKSFMDWRSQNGHDSFCEDVILDYFKELAQKYKSPSLWSLYSMLRSTLNINNNVNIEYYTNLRAFLKWRSEGYQAKKAQTFTPEEINKFINEAPDDIFLATKVASIMGIMGACRSNELHLMTIKDVEDLGSALLVTVPNTKTKIGRRFTITGSFYQICKKYMELRPANSASTSFFLNFQKGKCTTQNIGINKLGAMGKQIAKFLKLPFPEQYTGHSFRKSSATLYVGADGDITTLRNTCVVYFAEGRKYPKIIVNGYEFKLHLRTPESSVWACTQHAKYKCKVRLITTGQQIQIKDVAHSHAKMNIDTYEGLRSHKVKIIYTDRLQIKK